MQIMQSHSNMMGWSISDIHSLRTEQEVNAKRYFRKCMRCMMYRHHEIIKEVC